MQKELPASCCLGTQQLKSARRAAAALSLGPNQDLVQSTDKNVCSVCGQSTRTGQFIRKPVGSWWCGLLVTPRAGSGLAGRQSPAELLTQVAGTEMVAAG